MTKINQFFNCFYDFYFPDTNPQGDVEEDTEQLQTIHRNLSCTNTSPSIRDRRNKNIWSQILMKFDQKNGSEDEFFVKFWF